MKRFLCFLLAAALFLSGCQFSGDRIKDPVTFYYIQNDYQNELTTVFGSEEKEASGHRNDLSYLMTLYLMGPASETLRSPIPTGTRINVEANNKYAVKLQLSEPAVPISDADFSMICACLAMTCIEFTQTRSVTIVCGNRNVSMTKDNLELIDSTMSFTTEENE